MKKIGNHIIGVLALFVVIQGSAFAVSDTFTVDLSITTLDPNPPTIPTSVSATAVTTSQIDITWNASTDDVLLSGYRLFRDSTQIATTSLTSYSDTGLLENTDYTYYVEAYDSSLNISTSSATSSATTLVRSSTSAGGSLQVRMINFSITVDQTQVQIDWKTNIHTKHILRWGKNGTYNLGVVQDDVFKKTQRALITGLETGTEYSYELLSYNRQNNEYVLARDVFTTEVLADVTAPLNVSNLKGVAVDSSVNLSWVNPTDKDFQKVRIVRNLSFYPSDQVDGFVVYEGKNKSFIDTDVLVSDAFVYYTVFSYDEVGNISSGATVFVQKKVPVNDTPTRDINNSPQGNQATTSPETPTTTPEIIVESPVIDFTFRDLHFVQADIEVLWENNLLVVSNHSPVTLYIPYTALPEHLKTIVVQLTDKNGQEQSYILRVNQKKTKYEATIAPLSDVGVYTVSVSVYDFATELITTVEGPISSEETFNVDQMTNYSIINSMSPIAITLSVASFIFVLLILLTAYLIVVRRHNTI